MSKYIAIINEPGYLPTDEPVEFDSTRDAWEYLETEMEQDYDRFMEWLDESDVDDYEDENPTYPDRPTVPDYDEIGTLYFAGYAYSVDIVE